MADLADLYPGYASRWIDTAAGKIFARLSAKAEVAASPPARPSAKQCDVAPRRAGA